MRQKKQNNMYITIDLDLLLHCQIQDIIQQMTKNDSFSNFPRKLGLRSLPSGHMTLLQCRINISTTLT